MPKTVILPLVAALLLSAPAFAADPLGDSFTKPPESARPWTWWHWISGNVSREGITADLEAMKQIGLGGAQIFTVDQSSVHGPVKFMSPEWRALVAHALSEAHRLGLTISMEGCDGWSESGGPWVQPAESMKKVVFTQRHADGGGKLSLDLPQPETIRGFYKDIAMVAFPETPGPESTQPAGATSSDPAFDAAALVKREPNGAKLTISDMAKPAWVQVEYAKPLAPASLRLDVHGDDIIRVWTVESSADGAEFKKLGSVKPGATLSFQPIAARFFRVSAEKLAHTGTVSIVFTLGGPVLDDLSGRTAGTPSIRASDFPAKTDFPAGDIVAPKTIVDLTGRKEWDAPAGSWTIMRIGFTSTGVTTHPSTAAGLECDKLSAEAVRHHIENMFNPVIGDSPGLAGNTFKYILLDSWEAGCQNWTDKMPEEFRARRGYDLMPWLPTLTGKVVSSAEETERFLWDLRRTIADLVAENHYKVIQQYAHEHQMGLASEATGIGMPTVADQLLCKKYCDIPMGEFWVNSSRDRNIDDTKEAASAAHIYGQNIAGAESFTATTAAAGWAKDPYSLKALGDEEFCVGINRFIFHRYAHQPWLDRKPGMCMGPWGTNFERTQTWWVPGRAWIQYITRCQALLQQGHFAADLCYYYGEGSPICVRHHELNPALPAGYDYDVCNTDTVLNMMTVKDGMLTVPSGMQYRMLVLPPTDRMTLRVMEKIGNLVKDGATIYGPKPAKSPSLAGIEDPEVAKLADAIWGPCDGQSVTEHACGKGRVIWGQPLEKALALPADFTAASGDLLFIHRRTDDADIYFVSNQDSRPLTTECTFRCTGTPELWLPDSGVRQTAGICSSGSGVTTLPIHFDPTGSTFVVFRRGAHGVPPPGVTGWKFSCKNTEQPVSNDDPPYTLPVAKGESLCFTTWKGGHYEFIRPGAESIAAEAPELPQPIEPAGPWQIEFPPKLGAPTGSTFEHLISWPDSPDPGIKYFSGTATYKKDFQLPPDFRGKNRGVLLDLGEVKNLAEVLLNGHNLGILWKPPFRVEITGSLKAGTNHLEVRVTNLWPNRLIGDAALPEEKRVTWASFSPYKPSSRLLPSGLLGPVKLIPTEQIELNLGK